MKDDVARMLFRPTTAASANGSAVPANVDIDTMANRLSAIPLAGPGHQVPHWSLTV